MLLYHTTPDLINKIYDDGLFGDCLFFSSSPYIMTGSTNYYVYTIDLKDSDIINDYDLYDSDVISDMCDHFYIDENTAISLLTGAMSTFKLDVEASRAADYSVYVQQLQSECAKKMGYVACKTTDEQGAVFIVSMTGHINKLKLLDK